MHGGAVARVAGIRPLALFDDARAREVYPMAFEQGLAYGARLSLPPAEEGPAA